MTDILRLKDQKEIPFFPETHVKAVIGLEGIYNAFNFDGVEVNIYVNASTGNDTNADGTSSKPFKTVQAAVNSMAKISNNRYNIVVCNGNYDEEVIITNISASNIEIVSENYHSGNPVNPATTNTGVMIKKITFSNIRNYCAVRGITQPNTITSTNEEMHWIKFDTVQYGVVSHCRAATNTKNLGVDYSAVLYSGSKGRVYENNFESQFQVLCANYISTVDLYSNNTGSNNNRVIRCGRSFVFAYNVAVTGTTMYSTWAAGQVLTAAQVVSTQYSMFGGTEPLPEIATLDEENAQLWYEIMLLGGVE